MSQRKCPYDILWPCLQYSNYQVQTIFVTFKVNNISPLLSIQEVIFCLDNLSRWCIHEIFWWWSLYRLTSMQAYLWYLNTYCLLTKGLPLRPLKRKSLSCPITNENCISFREKGTNWSLNGNQETRLESDYFFIENCSSIYKRLLINVKHEKSCSVPAEVKSQFFSTAIYSEESLNLRFEKLSS